MKGSFKRFIKKTSKVQRIALVAAIMVMIGAVASVSYIATKAASNDNGFVFTTDDGLWSYVWDRENGYKITIVAYNGTDTDITFPSKTYTHYDNGQYYDDTKVKFTAIDQHSDGRSFFTNIDASTVTSVKIPDNYTELGDNVFQYCSSLTSVQLPSNLVSIGNYTFNHCTALKSINIPDTLTSIGNGAFYNCSSLTSINISDNITSIGESAFAWCSSISEINIPSKLTAIQSGVFQGTAIKSLVMPYGITSIGYHSFDNCTQLVNVVIPQSVTSIEGYAFYKCTSLEKVIIPNSVTQLGSGIFSDCTSLKTVTLSKNITEIPYSMFSGCTSLTEVKNIDNVTSLGDYSFSNCTSLTKLTDGLTSIGEYALQNTAIDGSTFDMSKLEILTSYSFAGVTFSQAFTIPSNIVQINYRAFYGATIPKLTIPETVVSMATFLGDTTKITELVWDTQQNIPYNLLSDNPYIEKVTITKNISYISSYAFENATALKELHAKIINNIYSDAFYGATSLTTLDIIAVTNIDNYAFYNCTSLKDISSAIKNTTSIGKYAFQNCSSLGKLVLGPNVTTIGTKAFYNSGITELDGSNNNYCYMGDYAFANCSKLTTIQWNSPLMSKYVNYYTTYYAKYAFANNTALQTATFGKRCTSFSSCQYLFSGCSEAFTDVYILYADTTTPYNTNIFEDTPGTQIIHYYGGIWPDYYSFKGKNQSIQLQLETDAEESPSSIAIDQSDITINVGDTVQLSATLTYTDSTAAGTSDKIKWCTTDASYAVVDDNGLVTGMAPGSTTIYIQSKENYCQYTITVTVVGETETPTSKPANKITLNNVVVDGTYINQREYVDEPFGLDYDNNGANVYINFDVKPAYSSDTAVVEVTEGSDILQFNYQNYWNNTTYSSYTAYFTHQCDDEGNYKYGKVTIKISAGDVTPVTYTFNLQKYEKIPTDVCFDNASKAKKNIVVGQTYTYTAFPLNDGNWDGSAEAGPYAWYEVLYELSDSSIADVTVELVEGGVVDPNDSSKVYDAYVATVTPKKAGTVTLQGYTPKFKNSKNSKNSISLTVTDPDNLGEDDDIFTPTERPSESGDPDVIWATSVTFPQEKIIMAVGKTRNLSPTITPTNHTDELNYYSYDKSIASIDINTGVITANAVGETTLGVSTSSGLHASVKVVVVEKEVPTTAVKLTPTTLALKNGDFSILQATITPSNTTDMPTWTSSNSDVVTVNAGAITAVGNGTATITVTSGNYKATCTVTVTPSATGVTLNQTTATISHGATLQLKATVEPSGVTSTATWKSSNEKIAKVSSTGVVTAVGYGDVDITVTVDKVTAKCTVSVVPTLDFKILGASIRVSDPYGIRFGIQLGKTGDYGDVKIVEYGTVMLPTNKLSGAELSLATPQVLKVEGKTIYSETSSQLVYTGVLINIPNSFFDTDVSGRGYLTYEDTNGVQHTIYTDIVSRSFNGVAQSAYDSYSKISNPTTAQKNVLDKLKEILNIN